MPRFSRPPKAKVVRSNRTGCAIFPPKLSDSWPLRPIALALGRVCTPWRARVQTYLKSEAKEYAQALEATAALIDGFESPFGMELLATVDWLLAKEGVAPTVPAVRESLRYWRGGPDAAERKNRLFDDRALDIALRRLAPDGSAPV